MALAVSSPLPCAERLIWEGELCKPLTLELNLNQASQCITYLAEKCTSWRWFWTKSFVWIRILEDYSKLNSFQSLSHCINCFTGSRIPSVVCTVYVHRSSTGRPDHDGFLTLDDRFGVLVSVGNSTHRVKLDGFRLAGIPAPGIWTMRGKTGPYYAMCHNFWAAIFPHTLHGAGRTYAGGH